MKRFSWPLQTEKPGSLSSATLYREGKLETFESDVSLHVVAATAVKEWQLSEIEFAAERLLETRLISPYREK